MPTHASWEFILVLIRHGSIASVTTISGMQTYCVQYQVKETNMHRIPKIFENIARAYGTEISTKKPSREKVRSE